MKQNRPNSSAEERQTQIAIWVAGVFIALSLALLALSLYIVVIVQQGRFDLSDKVLMPIAAMMFGSSLVSFALIRRGRLALGTGVLFVVVVLVPPIAATLVLKGFGSTSVAYAVLMAWIMIQFVLPQRSRTLAVAAALVTILLCVGIELLNPEFRTGTDVFGFTTALTAVAGLTMLAYLARQFRNYSLRTKFILAFSITSISIALATTFVYYNNQKTELLEAFRRTATSSVGIAALQQNGDEFARISSAQDPLYEKFRVQNLKIRQSDPQFVYVFTASQDDQGL